MYVLILYMWVLLWFCPSSKTTQKTSKTVSTAQKRGGGLRTGFPKRRAKSALREIWGCHSFLNKPDPLPPRRRKPNPTPGLHSLYKSIFFNLRKGLGRRMLLPPSSLSLTSEEGREGNRTRVPIVHAVPATSLFGPRQLSITVESVRRASSQSNLHRAPAELER